MDHGWILAKKKQCAEKIETVVSPSLDLSLGLKIFLSQ